MPQPIARVIVYQGIADVDVLRSGVSVEVRNYDVEAFDEADHRLWTDERKRRCIRYFVGPDGKQTTKSRTVADLERFVEDLNDHAGVNAVLQPDESADGLHVVTINRVDYYFNSDDGGYDGCGRQIG